MTPEDPHELDFDYLIPLSLDEFSDAICLPCPLPLRSDFSSSIFICVSGGDEMAILRSGEHEGRKEGGIRKE